MKYSDVARVCCPQTQQSQAKHYDASELLHCRLCTQEHPGRRVQGVKPHLKRLLTALPSLLTFKSSNLSLKLWRVQSGSLADRARTRVLLFSLGCSMLFNNKSKLHKQTSAKHCQAAEQQLSRSPYLLTAWNTHIQPDNHYHRVIAKIYHQLFQHVLTRSVRHNTWVLMQTALRDMTAYLPRRTQMKLMK